MINITHLVPALDHECIHSTGAILWAGKQLPRSDHLNHLHHDHDGNGNGNDDDGDGDGDVDDHGG